jgi:hypothetical protein
MTIGPNGEFYGPSIKPGLDMHTYISQQAAVSVDELSGKPGGLGIRIARRIAAEQAGRRQMLKR